MLNTSFPLPNTVQELFTPIPRILYIILQSEHRLFALSPRVCPIVNLRSLPFSSISSSSPPLPRKSSLHPPPNTRVLALKLVFLVITIQVHVTTRPQAITGTICFCHATETTDIRVVELFTHVTGAVFDTLDGWSLVLRYSEGSGAPWTGAAGVGSARWWTVDFEVVVWDGIRDGFERCGEVIKVLIRVSCVQELWSLLCSEGRSWSWRANLGSRWVGVCVWFRVIWHFGNVRF